MFMNSLSNSIKYWMFYKGKYLTGPETLDERNPLIL